MQVLFETQNTHQVWNTSCLVLLFDILLNRAIPFFSGLVGHRRQHGRRIRQLLSQVSATSPAHVEHWHLLFWLVDSSSKQSSAIELVQCKEDLEGSLSMGLPCYPDRRPLLQLIRTAWGGRKPCGTCQPLTYWDVTQGRAQGRGGFGARSTLHSSLARVSATRAGAARGCHGEDAGGGGVAAAGLYAWHARMPLCGELRLGT